MAKNYVVNEILERSRITADGQVEKYFKLKATSPKGTAFTVDIPESQMDLAEVERIVGAQAKKLDSIKD